ncbi:rRNA-binding ribosome biosynthesis protein rpf2 [Bonamia ostreae]|uniref:rRNA-binding ribosome biosynthesis protein rpf2 n=1 Tax=Bonamia ostreae TaxID=126728 RepID=A0ABV2AFF6_9EUKA
MDKLKKIKNLFVDFFRGKETDFVDLKYIKRAIVFAAIDFETIRFTDYAVTIKQDNNVSLEEIGPSFELKLKRNYIASEKLLSTSLKKPKKMVNEPKKVKNVKTDNFGSKIGKVHVDKQDIRKINKRKFKGYKKNRKD